MIRKNLLTRHKCKGKGKKEGNLMSFDGVWTMFPEMKRKTSIKSSYDIPEIHVPNEICINLTSKQVIDE